MHHPTDRDSMRRSIAAFSLLAASPLAIAQPALAQGLRGELAEQSRARVQISVSVAPVFDPKIALDPAGAAIVHLKSSRSGLRYAVITDPAQAGLRADAPLDDAPHPRSHQRLLVLVVPD